MVSFFWLLIYILSVTSSYDVTPSLFSQTRPKISDSLVIRASPSHWKEGEKTRTCTRHVYVDLSSSPFSVSRGWAPEEGADGTRRTPHPHLLPQFFVVSIFQSLTSTLFPFRNLSSTVSSRSASPHPFRIHSCASCSPDWKKKEGIEKSWRRDPWDVICPRGIVVEEQ